MLLLVLSVLVSTEYTVYADGLASPDGLTRSHEGIVFVSEERAGIVTGFTPTGARFTVMDGLANPEGIAWHPRWGILVVEDVPRGRLLSSVAGTLQEGIPNPEGVVVTEDGTIYYTWAHIGGPTGICRWQPHRPDTLLALPLGFMLSGLALGPDEHLYACNESPVVGSILSVVRVNPETLDWLPYAGGIPSAEGLAFTPDGKTLMVASENEGNVIAVSEDGEASVFASVGSTIEGIMFMPDGSMLITDDGRGKILELEWP